MICKRIITVLTIFEGVLYRTKLFKPDYRYSANFVYQKLKNKGIILRSTEDGYHIKNKLRLTIGSKKENLKFMSVIKQVLKK